MFRGTRAHRRSEAPGPTLVPCGAVGCAPAPVRGDRTPVVARAGDVRCGAVQAQEWFMIAGRGSSRSNSRLSTESPETGTWSDQVSVRPCSAKYSSGFSTM